MKDYYGILEVNVNASNEVIEKAYKTLVKKYHPDLYLSIDKKEAEKKLKDINEAYNILSDSFLRSQYNLELQKQAENAQRQENQRRADAENNETTYTENRNRRTRNNNMKTGKNSNRVIKRQNNVGTIFGIVDLVKELWKNKPEKRERRKMNQTDWLALALTIVAILIIGIILWFIPFTNGWMRQLLFENPIFNFIGGLFS